MFRSPGLALLLMLGAAPAAGQTFPNFSGFVVDEANVLPPAVEAELTAKLDALQRDTKRQFVVATIADPQNYELADYGYRLGRAWNVGLGDVYNGAILFIAPNNPPGQRGPRLEVSKGLEPILTDAFASIVIYRDMMPRLTSGDVPGAMVAGTEAVIAQLRASPEEAQARLDAAVKEFDRTRQDRTGRGQRGDGIPFALIFWGLIFLFVVLPMLRRGGGRGRRHRGGESGFGSVAPIILWDLANAASRSSRGVGGWSGGAGGGGWGGGGFSGGGGGGSGFSGGGASGSW